MSAAAFGILGVLLVVAVVSYVAHLKRAAHAADESAKPADAQWPNQPVVDPPPSSAMKFVITVNGVEHDYSQHPLFLAIAPSLANGLWDDARRYLQKIAYGVAAGTEAEKEEFKFFMMGFASVDPLYARCIDGIRPILHQHPDGIRQTALYPHMVAAPDTETARYVLYYADLLGAIRRTKKGNSYTVFSPGGSSV